MDIINGRLLSVWFRTLFRSHTATRSKRFKGNRDPKLSEPKGIVIVRRYLSGHVWDVT
jgi:hypothetical protein